MTQGAFRRGVTLYSFQEEYFLRKFTLEECIARSASLGAFGIEIIGEQMFPGFPTLTDDFVRQWFGWMDKYGTTPTCHDMFLDTKRYKHRRLTQQEEVDSVERDLKFASRLGCKVMRVIVSASPETMELCLPLAEKYRVKMGIEVHSPFHLDQPWIMRHIELMHRTGSEYYGLIPDMGIFTNRYPRVQRDRFVRNGVRPEFADYITSAYEQRILPEYIVGNVREMNPTPLKIAMAESTRHLVWTNPDRLREHIKLIVHIHGKFLEMVDDRTEFSIPYEKIIPVLKDAGFNGYISSEYEGNRHIEDAFPVDSFEQVRRHQAMLKHLLGEN